MDKITPKLLFSFTDEYGVTTTLEKTFNAEEYDEDFGNAYWLLDEFKYFLQSMSFPSSITDRMVYLERDEEVVTKKED